MDKSFENQKKEIELSLARILLTQLQKKTFTFQESQKIANYLLEGLDSVENSDQLLEFLKIISKEFPVFGTTYGFYKLRREEEIKMQHSLSSVKNNLQSLGGI